MAIILRVIPAIILKVSTQSRQIYNNSFNYLLLPGQEGLKKIENADEDTRLERCQQVCGVKAERTQRSDHQRRKELSQIESGRE